VLLDSGHRQEVTKISFLEAVAGTSHSRHMQGIHTNTGEYYIGLLQHSEKVENPGIAYIFIEHQQKQ
jgi:hypothetical protein